MSLPLNENFTQQRFRLSHGVGVNLSLYNDRGWGFSSGINYNITKKYFQYNGPFERDPSSPSIDTTWKSYDRKNIEYSLEIPLLFNYILVFKELKLKMDIGCTTTYIVKEISTGTINFLNGNIENVKYKNLFLGERFIFYPTMIIGLEKKIGNYCISLSPTIRYGIMDGSQYDWLIGLTFGVYKSLS